MIRDLYGKEVTNTINLIDQYGQIDFMDWLINCRGIIYELRHKGFLIRDNKLMVRNLQYKNRTFAFNCVGRKGDYCIIPLLVEEDKLISGYQIALENKYYIEFIKNMLILNAEHIEETVNDTEHEEIIKLLNIILREGKALPIQNNMLVDWDFNPWNMCEQLEMIKNACQKYTNGEYVKLTNKSANKTYYGCITALDNDETEIGNFKCYYADYDEYADNAYCFKYFLPDNFAYARWIMFDKAIKSELTEAQVENLKKYQNSLSCRRRR